MAVRARAAAGRILLGHPPAVQQHPGILLIPVKNQHYMSAYLLTCEKACHYRMPK